MKASDLLVRCLEAEGVDYVFGVPGEENEDLLFSLRDSRIAFVPTRHEQGAAFIANLWGRLTGRAGVCLSTLGPGATNLLTGVADAYLDKSPMVVLTGQGGMERLHKESHQSIDVVAMFEPICKWNAQLGSPHIVPEAVRKAFKVAEFEKPGPTHLELPEDIAGMDTDRAPLEPKTVRRAAPDYKALEKTDKLLHAAERPLVLAGNGAIRKLASSHLRTFVTGHDIPVVSTFMGKGAVSDLDDHSLMTLGTGPDEPAIQAIRQADLIIAVGYDIAEHDPANWNPGAVPLIHVDFLPAEVDAHYQPDVEVVCDISAALWELNRRCEEQTFDRTWYDGFRREIMTGIKAAEPANAGAFTLRNVLPVLREVMDERDILISDVGRHKMAIARSFPTCIPNGCIISNGLASMGIAVPGGIAASLVAPEVNVVAATGDGGFLMNAAEIETATRLDLTYTILLFNDNDYGLISSQQKDHRGEAFGTELGNPDYMKFADSFGIRGYRPHDGASLRRDLQAAVHGDEMALVEVPL